MKVQGRAAGLALSSRLAAMTSLIAMAKQVTEEDLQRVAKATGAQVQTTVNGLSTSALGTCAQFQEKQVRPPLDAPHVVSTLNLWAGMCSFVRVGYE